jgi:hypothetical protein
MDARQLIGCDSDQAAPRFCESYRWQPRIKLRDTRPARVKIGGFGGREERTIDGQVQPVAKLANAGIKAPRIRQWLVAGQNFRGKSTRYPILLYNHS